MTQDTNTSSGATIGNAVEIIERFGGIRPMSAKTGIPVTTIQGWKQRNAIPLNRRNELIEAANKHGVPLGELLVEIAGVKDEGEGEEIVFRPQAAASARSESASQDVRPGSHQTTLIAAGALVLAAGVLGIVLAMAPKVNDVSGQDMRIRELEQQLAAMREAKDTVDAAAPSEFTNKLSELEGQVGQLAEVAKDFQSGSVSQRIAKLEGSVGGLVKQANIQGLQSLIQKFSSLQGTQQGMGQLDSLVAAFAGSAESSEKEDDLTANFTKLRETNPQVAETFKDVAPEDMKAAVMLLGMSQLRDSLARDRQSFDTDLTLMKHTVAKDDPALQEAIDRLAPQAKSGVLTPQGLSSELRGLTGEIVAASLAGENISIQDKAIARLNDVIKVQKNGEQISGTQTQITIAEAQKRLDSGDVEGAVVLLQQIQGPAAQKTKPVIDAAQASLLASQVQQMLGQNLVGQLKSMTGHNASYTASGGISLDPQGVVNQIKNLGIGGGQ